MDERRKFQRFKIGVEVRWKKVSGDRTAQHISQIKDISAGGVCLVLDPSVQVGDTLEMQMRLPGDQSILTRGQVTWIDPQAHVKGWGSAVCEGGVQFLDLDEDKRSQIDKLLQHESRRTSRK